MTSVCWSSLNISIVLKTMSFISVRPLVLNAENAFLVADLLERLPRDIYQQIMEYNADHNQKWKIIMSQFLRNVFCPSYFHAAEDEIYCQRELNTWAMAEMNVNFYCHRCGKKKEGCTVLRQHRIGFWRSNGLRSLSSLVLFCAKCYGLNHSGMIGNQVWSDSDNEYDNYDVDETYFDD